jgi:WD40 repeat protein
MSEYISAIAPSNDGRCVAVADAAGQVWRIDLATQERLELQSNTGTSIDALGFSTNDQFLAAAGQAGTVTIWQMQPEPKQIAALVYGKTWIDRLAWHPTESKLAFQVGFDLYIWDAATQELLVTLPIGATAQAMQWHPKKNLLAVAANDRLLTWQNDDWHKPSEITLAAPATAIAWSNDGTYLALGNLERNLFVWEWDNPDPWRMQGFPGKASQLAWGGDERLAMSSLEGIVVWQRSGDNWQNQILLQHQEKVTAIAFQPSTHILASAGLDGDLLLWQDGTAEAVLDGATDGFSTLAWQSQGEYLIAGGVNGEVKIWQMAQAS